MERVDFMARTPDSMQAYDVDTAEGRDALQTMQRESESAEQPSGSPQPQHLDYTTWLPFAAKPYNISGRPEDYVIVNTPMLPSDIPNRNGVAFPLSELVAFQPPPTNRQVYKAWAGCPVHLEHDNKVHERALGVILDTMLVPIRGYGGGELWKVMGLLAFDKTKHPDIAQKVLKGLINTYSMGALCNYFTCALCGTRMSSRQHCHHLNPHADLDFSSALDPLTGNDTMIFRNAHVLSPIECSLVEDPAWTTALSDIVMTMD